MKRPLTIVAIALLTALVIHACGSTIRTADTSVVTITIGEGHKTAMLRAEKATPWSRLLYFLADAKLTPKAHAAIPQEVAVVVVTVSAPDMTTMVTVVPVAGLEDIAITLDVPNGTDRNFLVEGFDASSTVVYRGQASANLKGDPVSLTIDLARVGLDTLPPAFNGLELVSNVTGTTAQLSWPPATDAVTPSSEIVYLIYQATTPSGEIYTSPTYTTLAGETSYTVTGLTPGVTYYFVVRARDAAGNIDSNTLERTTTTPDTTPPAFAGLSLVTNVTYTSMQLSWSAATDNVTPSANIAYLVYQAETPGGEVYTAASYTTSPGATTYEVAGLVPGNTYYFVVRARDAAGNVDSNTVERSQAQPGLHVAIAGDDITGDGSSASPYRTITKALSFPSGTNIFVSQGTYSSVVGGGVGSETFPLQLKTGTALFCTGLNYATVISGRGQPVTGVIMNDSSGFGSTLVDGCTIEAPSNELLFQSNTGIEDSGFSMTIRNTKVLGTFSGFSYGQTGIVLGGDSSVVDTVVSGFSGGEGGSIGMTIGSGNVLVTRSTVSGNDDGIHINGGTAIIDDNLIESNSTGIMVSFVSPTITNNTIRNNTSAGISVVVSAGPAPLIQHNEISCTYFGPNLTTSSTTTLDVRNNSWENEPPLVADATVGCSQGTDICYFGPLPDYLPADPTVPGVCVRPGPLAKPLTR